MAIGTAGYTAMLAVMALERHGLTPRAGRSRSPARPAASARSAIAMLAKRGFTVHAVTGRPQEADYLKGLGAAEIVERKELAGPPKPLAKERWAGARRRGRLHHAGQPAVDDPLWRGGGRLRPGRAAWTCRPRSRPFILRGVCLYGIDSVMCPHRAAQGSVEKAGNRPGPPETGRDDHAKSAFRGCPRPPPASWPGRCGAESWSRSGKHVQDLATNGGHSPLGLNDGPRLSGRWRQSEWWACCVGLRCWSACWPRSRRWPAR